MIAAAAIAAAASLAMPIVGTAPGVEASTFLAPETLAPIPGAATVPSGIFNRPAISPDGGTVAYDGLRRTRLFATDTGRRAGSFRSPGADLYWLTERRLIAVDPGRNQRLTVVDPRSGRVVSRRKVAGRIGVAAQTGTRLLLLVAKRREAEQRLVVLRSSGRVERTVRLRGLRSGRLHPASPDGRAYAVGGASVFAVDLSTGDVTRADGPDGDWVAPTVPGALAYYDYARLRILDPATLETVKTLPVEGDGPVGAGTGFTSLAREEGKGVTVYDAEGDVVWHADQPADGLGIGAIGDRLYVATGYDDVRVRVYDLATGTLVRENPGRYSAGTPGASGFSNAQSLED